jgi:hypothetical protein
MKTVTSMAEAMALGSDLKLYVDAPDSIRVYFPGEIPEPLVDENPVPQSVSPLQAYLALDQAGVASAFEAWASNPARSFAEKAFINRAQEWRRDDPVLSAGAAALGLTDEQLDGLFVLAATL